MPTPTATDSSCSQATTGSLSASLHFSRLITNWRSGSESAQIPATSRKSRSQGVPPDVTFNGYLYPICHRRVSLSANSTTTQDSSVQCVGHNFGSNSWMHRSCKFRYTSANRQSVQRRWILPIAHALHLTRTGHVGDVRWATCDMDAARSVLCCRMFQKFLPLFDLTASNFSQTAILSFSTKQQHNYSELVCAAHRVQQGWEC